MLNLFGEEVKEPSFKPREKLSIYQQAKKDLCYRKAYGNESCKNCGNLVIKEYDKRYFKCNLIGISNCSATDIRLGDYCDRWEKKK
jgi:hypothetical protein